MAFPSNNDEHIHYLRGAVQYLAYVISRAVRADPTLIDEADQRMKEDEKSPLGPFTHSFGKEGAWAAREMLLKTTNEPR